MCWLYFPNPWPRSECGALVAFRNRYGPIAHSGWKGLLTFPTNLWSCLQQVRSIPLCCHWRRTQWARGIQYQQGARQWVEPRVCGTASVLAAPQASSCQAQSFLWIFWSKTEALAEELGQVTNPSIPGKNLGYTTWSGNQATTGIQEQWHSLQALRTTRSCTLWFDPFLSDNIFLSLCVLQKDSLIVCNFMRCPKNKNGIDFGPNYAFACFWCMYAWTKQSRIYCPWSWSAFSTAIGCITVNV